MPRINLFAVLVLAMVANLACQRSPEVREARFLERGKALFAKKDYARALLEYRNAAAAKPDDAEPYYRQGLVFLETGDIASAVGAFQKATVLNPGHIGAQLKLAELFTGSQDEQLIRDAVARLQNSFGNSPGDPEAFTILWLAEWKLGKPEEAAGRLEQALMRFPTDLETSVTLARMKVSAKDWTGAERILTKAVASIPNSAIASVALGEFYVYSGQPAKAEGSFRRALELDPKNAGAMQSLGMILISSKRMDEAEQIFKKFAGLPDKAFRPVHALFAYQFGNREEAIKEFEALVKADPSDRTSRTRLVAAYFTAGRIPDATKVLTEALRRNPKDTDALLQRAEMRLKAGNAADAASDVTQVLSLNPDSAIGHVLSAKIYLAQGHVKNQQDELQAAIRLNPSLLAARIALATSFLSGGQAKAALGVMDETPANQKTDYSALLTRNWVLLAMGNLQEAAPAIQKTLGVRSQEAVYQAAVLHYLQKDYAGVRVLVDELLKRGDTDPWIPQLMMDAYAAQRESSKGLERLKDFTAAHPGSAPLHHLLGEWLVRAGDTAAGRKAFEKAAEVDPGFVQAKLSMAQLDLDQGHVELARQNLKTFLQTQPANVEALLLAARADISSGDQRSVIARYRSVLAIDNSNIVALNNLAYVLLADKPDEALKFAQMAVERSPESAFAQDTLGWVYFRKGLYTMAVPHLQTAVEKEPTARRQYHLGMCYIKAGEQTKGQNIVNQALQKEPGLGKTEQVW